MLACASSGWLLPACHVMQQRRHRHCVTWNLELISLVATSNRFLQSARLRSVVTVAGQRAPAGLCMFRHRSCHNPSFKCWHLKSSLSSAHPLSTHLAGPGHGTHPLKCATSRRACVAALQPASPHRACPTKLFLAAIVGLRPASIMAVAILQAVHTATWPALRLVVTSAHLMADASEHPYLYIWHARFACTFNYCETTEGWAVLLPTHHHSAVLRAWTWNSSNKMCYLKKGVYNRSASSIATSGVPNKLAGAVRGYKEENALS